MLNITNKQYWYKTHLKAGLLHMFSAQIVKLRSPFKYGRNVWTFDKQDWFEFVSTNLRGHFFKFTKINK
jgi:hypothetical protein